MLSYSSVKIMTLEYYKKSMYIYLKFKGMFYNGICPKCETLLKRHKMFSKREYYLTNFELLKFQPYIWM